MPNRPLVDAVTPKRGPDDGGQSVLIQGSYFTGATAVTFGFTAAASFVVQDDSHIVAISPVYSMRDQNGNPLTQVIVDVIVTTPSGSSPTVTETTSGQFSTNTGDQYEFYATSAPAYVDPIDALSNLRALIGERIPTGKQDTDTMLDDQELTGMIARHNGNLYLAAAEGWSVKAAEYADMIDVNESGSSRSLSQLFKQANVMSQNYQKAGIEWWRSTFERPVAKTASYLKPGLGSPSELPALGIPSVIDPGFSPWFSPTARWWPLVTVMLG